MARVPIDLGVGQPSYLRKDGQAARGPGLRPASGVVPGLSLDGVELADAQQVAGGLQLARLEGVVEAAPA